MENMQAIWVIPIDGITMDVVDEAYNTTCVLMMMILVIWMIWMIRNLKTGRLTGIGEIDYVVPVKVRLHDGMMHDLIRQIITIVLLGLWL